MYYWTGTLADTPADSSYTNSQGNQVNSPNYDPTGATAMCIDGTFSHSQDTQGSCSSHGGVDHLIGTASASTTPTCDTTQQQAYETQYNTAVSEENTSYQNQLAQAQQQSSDQLGGMSSGLSSNQTTEITQQHQLNLSSLQSQLDSNLASIDCTQ